METKNNTTKSEQSDASEWGVVELMGHCTMAGLISEIEMFGGIMGHILTPYANGKSVVRLFNRTNIYRMTLCDEATARRVIEWGYLPTDGHFTAEEIGRHERDFARPRHDNFSSPSGTGYFGDDGDFEEDDLDNGLSFDPDGMPEGDEV